MRSVFFDNTTFYQALSLLASAQIIENGRFPARNFLLESQLPRSRVDEYTSRLGLPTAGGNAQASLSAFSGFHNAYVEDELRRAFVPTISTRRAWTVPTPSGRAARSMSSEGPTKTYYLFEWRTCPL